MVMGKQSGIRNTVLEALIITQKKDHGIIN